MCRISARRSGLLLKRTCSRRCRRCKRRRRCRRCMRCRRCRQVVHPPFYASPRPPRRGCNPMHQRQQPHALGLRLTAPAQKRLQLANGPSPASPRCGMHPSPTHSRGGGPCTPCSLCTPCIPCRPCSRRRRRRAAQGPTAAWLASCCLLSCGESLWSRPHKGPHSCPSGVGSRICAARVGTGRMRSADR